MEQHKKYRLARRQVKQRNEELLVSTEGETYVAAAFDEVLLYRAGKKKKRKSTCHPLIEVSFVVTFYIKLKFHCILPQKAFYLFI